MKTIYFNSAVAKRCGKNGIIKAVLLNYIYNYNKHKPREGAGSPARISLAQFVYQYKVDDKGLWERSFIHETLTTLVKDLKLIKPGKTTCPVYTVSPDIIELLTAKDAKIVSFDLEMAYKHGIHIAIMHRFLLHVIDKAPKGEAYNLDPDDMAEVNRLSKAQIYRAIKYLVEEKVIMRVKSSLTFRSRKLSLARYKS